jgi:hypothetical protein
MPRSLGHMLPELCSPCTNQHSTYERKAHQAHQMHHDRHARQCSLHINIFDILLIREFAQYVAIRHTLYRSISAKSDCLDMMLINSHLCHVRSSWNGSIEVEVEPLMLEIELCTPVHGRSSKFDYNVKDWWFVLPWFFGTWVPRNPIKLNLVVSYVVVRPLSNRNYYPGEFPSYY